MIVPCRPAESIVGTWLKATEAYVPRRYPHMHRDAVVYGGTGNGDAGTLVLSPLLRAHPQLRGLIFLCPSEAYTGPPQLIKAHKVGKVFTAGNGGGCPPLYSAYAWNRSSWSRGDRLRRGPDQARLSDGLGGRLPRRRPHVRAGKLDVGGPVGTVQYFSQNEELRLGQPLTITKANVGKYAGK